MHRLCLFFLIKYKDPLLTNFQFLSINLWYRKWWYELANTARIELKTLRDEGSYLIKPIVLRPSNFLRECLGGHGVNSVAHVTRKIMMLKTTSHQTGTCELPHQPHAPPLMNSVKTISNFHRTNSLFFNLTRTQIITPPPSPLSNLRIPTWLSLIRLESGAFSQRPLNPHNGAVNLPVTDFPSLLTDSGPPT